MPTTTQQRFHLGQVVATPNALSAFERNECSPLGSLPSDAQYVRIHVGGDLYSPEYIKAWMAICKARPDVRFWAYTRSWTVGWLCQKLEPLRRLSNMQLFASVDETMPMPPKGWRMAFIEGDSRATGLPCKEQHQQAVSCHACGYCFKPRKGHVVFKAH